MDALEDVWVSGVIANLLAGYRKLPPSVFREVSALLMQLLAFDHRMTKAMVFVWGMATSSVMISMSCRPPSLHIGRMHVKSDQMSGSMQDQEVDKEDNSLHYCIYSLLR